LVAAEVDAAVQALVPAAAMPGRDAAVGVAPAARGAAPLDEGALGPHRGELLEGGDAHLAAAGRSGLVDAGGHRPRLPRRTRSSGPGPAARPPSSTPSGAPRSGPAGGSCAACAWCARRAP